MTDDWSVPLNIQDIMKTAVMQYTVYITCLITPCRHQSLIKIFIITFKNFASIRH